VNDVVVVHLHENEDGGLAFLDAFEEVRVLAVPGWQLRQLVRKFEQQLESITDLEFVEVRADLGERLGQR
jgi:hypothetical protein